MLESEVPQEKNKIFEGGRKAMYAVGGGGDYKIVPSDGWSAEEIATTSAVDEFNMLKNEALGRFKDKIASPIEFLMYKNRMDLPTLSSIVKMFEWRIKRHFRPVIFDELDDKMLSKYADAFDISLDELKNLWRQV
jgi:hypothetical protein